MPKRDSEQDAPTADTLLADLEPRPGVAYSSLTDFRGFGISPEGTALGVGKGARSEPVERGPEPRCTTEDFNEIQKMVRQLDEVPAHRAGGRSDDHLVTPNPGWSSEAPPPPRAGAGGDVKTEPDLYSVRRDRQRSRAILIGAFCAGAVVCVAIFALLVGSPDRGGPPATAPIAAQPVLPVVVASAAPRPVPPDLPSAVPAATAVRASRPITPVPNPTESIDPITASTRAGAMHVPTPRLPPASTSGHDASSAPTQPRSTPPPAEFDLFK